MSSQGTTRTYPRTLPIQLRIMICRILVLLLFLGTNAYWREASGTEPNPLDLSYHLIASTLP